MTSKLSEMLQKAGFVESALPEHTDTTPTPAPRTTAPDAAISMQTFGPGGAGMTFSGAITPEDEKRLNDMATQLYSVPSAYLPFRDFRQMMGGTSDIATLMKMLLAANPGLSADKIRSAIDGHLQAIAKMKQQFENARAQMQKVDVDDQIARMGVLTTQIAAAQAELAQCQQHATASKQKIDEGETHFNMVIDKLSAPLNEAKQLLGNFNA